MVTSARSLIFPVEVEIALEERGLGPFCRSCDYFCGNLLEMTTAQCRGRVKGADGCEMGQYDPKKLKEEFAKGFSSSKDL